MPRKNLTGQRFGMLTVVRETDERKYGTIVWECKCDCGQTAYQKTNHLTTGIVTSCGCRSRASRFTPVDITEQRFGMLTAVRMSDKRKDTYVMWECLCDCGNTVLVSFKYLLRGWTFSCGCVKKNDLSGIRFGRLTALQPAKRKKAHGAEWVCRCDCGAEVTVKAAHLKIGKTKSCGCIMRDRYVEGTALHLLCQKKRKNNTSGTVGVSYDSSHDKWAASIRLQGKTYYLGRFKEKEDAIAARKIAEEKLHVSFLESHMNNLNRS